MHRGASMPLGIFVPLSVDPRDWTYGTEMRLSFTFRWHHMDRRRPIEGQKHRTAGRRTAQNLARGGQRQSLPSLVGVLCSKSSRGVGDHGRVAARPRRDSRSDYNESSHHTIGEPEYFDGIYRYGFTLLRCALPFLRQDKDQYPVC